MELDLGRSLGFQPFDLPPIIRLDHERCVAEGLPIACYPSPAFDRGITSCWLRQKLAATYRPMCNLYSLNKKRDMVARFFRVSHNRAATFKPSAFWKYYVN
jgi:hypothetical protein